MAKIDTHDDGIGSLEVLSQLRRLAHVWLLIDSTGKENVKQFSLAGLRSPETGGNIHLA